LLSFKPEDVWNQQALFDAAVERLQEAEQQASTSTLAIEMLPAPDPLFNAEEDVDFFRQRIYSALGVPKKYLFGGDDG
jgi:hypothetical protein